MHVKPVGKEQIQYFRVLGYIRLEGFSLCYQGFYFDISDSSYLFQIAQSYYTVHQFYVFEIFAFHLRTGRQKWL